MGKRIGSTELYARNALDILILRLRPSLFRRTRFFIRIAEYLGKLLLRFSVKFIACFYIFYFFLDIGNLFRIQGHYLDILFTGNDLVYQVFAHNDFLVCFQHFFDIPGQLAFPGQLDKDSPLENINL